MKLDNGRALRIARADLDWTQAQAERASGICREVISACERNERRPSAFTLSCLRGAYGAALKTAERVYGTVGTREVGGVRIAS